MRMIGEITALHTNGVHLLHILGDSHETGNRTERLAHIISIQTGDNHPLAPVSKLLSHSDKLLAEKLRLIDTDNLSLLLGIQHHFRVLDRRTRNAVQIM